MEKIEVARRQIDSAIKLFFYGDDPLAIASLAYPASQILRDLNRGNVAAVSNVITDILREDGFKPGLWRKEFNEVLGDLKHASLPIVSEKTKSVIWEKEQIGVLYFCIAEYSANNKGHITPKMNAFVKFDSKWRKRQDRMSGIAVIQKWLEKNFVITQLEPKYTFWMFFVKLLKTFQSKFTKAD